MLKKITRIYFGLFLVSLLSCSDTSGIDDIKEGDELVVLTRNAPTTMYEGREGFVGPEYDLVQSFAEFYKLKVRFEIKDSIDEVISSIQNNQAHIGAAGITITNQRRNDGLIFSKPYQTVRQQVVCRRGKVLPKSPEDLVERRLSVIDNSSYVETLNQLKLEHPELTWTIEQDLDTEQLLEKVWKKQIDCTLADSNIVKINRRYYPELIVAFAVTEEQPLAWVLSPKWGGLNTAIASWLKNIKASGELATLMDRYYGHFEIYDYVDLKRFRKRIKSRLPKYIKQFKISAEKNELSWTLLAAQAYQESHWNPRARSPTGVRGMMMLTLNTAQSVGVTSRLDPMQSIKGGARYLRRMIDRIPDEVRGEDRIWFALAAYNVGYGHLNDARLLAEKLGKDPDRWVELKEVLPLLSIKKYYKKLRHGYARGTEPVLYVQRIREYQHLLEQQL